MLKRRFTHFALGAAPLLLLAASSAPEKPDMTAFDTPAPMPEPAPKKPAEILRDPLVIVMDRSTGACWANTTNPDDLTKRFPQASLQKLVVIKAALDLIRDGKLSPNEEVRWTGFSRAVIGWRLSRAIQVYNEERKERLVGQAEKTLPEDATDTEINTFVEARYSAIPVPRNMSILQLIESAKKGSHNDSTRLLAQVVARKLGYTDNAEGINQMMEKLVKDYGLVATTASDPSGMTGEDLPKGTDAETTSARDLKVGMFSNAVDMLWLAHQTLDTASTARIVRTTALERVFKNSHLQINDFAGSDHFARFLGDNGLFLIKTGTQEDNYHMIAASRDGSKIYAVFGADDNPARKAGIETALRNQSALTQSTPPRTGGIFICSVVPMLQTWVQHFKQTNGIFSIAPPTLLQGPR